MLRYVLLLVVALWAAPYLSRREEAAAPAGDRATEQEVSALAAPPPPLPREPRTVDHETFPDEVAMHRAYAKHFVEQRGFGAGRIAYFPAPIGNRVRIDGRLYQVERRRLIGAWRPGVPRLFEAHAFARGHDPRSVPWVALDKTDTRALAAIRDGSDFVLDGGRTRAVGALRATDNCCRCHDVALGTVLGALRYDLAPIE